MAACCVVVSCCQHATQTPVTWTVPPSLKHMCSAIYTERGQESNSNSFGAVVARQPVAGGQSPSESARIVDCKAENSVIGSKQQSFVDGLKYGAAGGIAGAFAKSCTAPLARLTILYQVQGFSSAAGQAGCPVPPPKLRHAFLQVVRREGVAALWKGNLATILHRLPYSSINFYTYEHTNKFLVKRLPPNTDIARTLSAGALAGLVSCSAAYPLDLVRTRLAAQTQGHYYNGIVPTLQRIVADEGVLGLYRGLGATLLQVVPSLALNFCLYDTIRRSCMAVYNTADRQQQSRQQQQQEGLLRSSQQHRLPDAAAGDANSGSSSSKRKGILRSTGDPESLAHSLAVASTVDQGIQHSQMVFAHLSDDSASSSIHAAQAAAATAVDAYSTAGAAGGTAVTAGSSSSNSSAGCSSSISEKALTSSSRAAEVPAVVSLASGCISGFLTATATFPLDVIRRRMQVYGQQHHGEAVSYSRIYRQIMQQGGVKGFYYGILPEYCKVVPGVAIAFCTYEQLKKWLQAE